MARVACSNCGAAFEVEPERLVRGIDVVSAPSGGLVLVVDGDELHRCAPTAEDIMKPLWPSRTPVDWSDGSLGIDVGEVDGVTYIGLRGELDAVTAPRLRSQVTVARSSNILIDLSMLRFIDLSGARALLRLQDRITRAGRHVEIRGASGFVKQLIEMVWDHPLRRASSREREANDSTTPLRD